jgi:hypothetical protein
MSSTTRRLPYEDCSVTNELVSVRSYNDGGEAHDERERTTRARTTDERCSSEKTHAMNRTKRRKQPLTGLLSTNQQRLWKSLATVNLTEIRKKRGVIKPDSRVGCSRCKQKKLKAKSSG